MLAREGFSKIFLKFNIFLTGNYAIIKYNSMESLRVTG
jgi:hypothetical protein